MGAKAILSVLPFLLKEQAKKKLYNVYISECLYCIAENTAKSVGGIHMTQKYTDLINKKPQDTRTGEQIAVDVIKQCGLKVVEK